MKTPIEVFSDWVDIGKDEGMEKNHYMPVMEMIKLYNTSNAYSFIDAGCGNGWLVRYLFENTKCVNGIGVDGSNKMIKKATTTLIIFPIWLHSRTGGDIIQKY